MFHEHPPAPENETSDLALIGSRSVRHLMDDCSEMHLWRLTNDPSYQDLNFPKPIKINGRNYFRVSSVRQWIAERETLSRARQIARPFNTRVVPATMRIGVGHDH